MTSIKKVGIGAIILCLAAGAAYLSSGGFLAIFQRQDTGESGIATSSVLFLGDMMFDRNIRQIAEESDMGYHYLFSCSKDILLAQTAVVANLEGPITNNKSVSVNTKPGSTLNYQFTFAPDVTDALLLANIGYVSIGNNHIFNFGREGLIETREALSRAGISYFGDPLATTSVAYVPVSQGELALINYNEFWYPNVASTSQLVSEEKNAGRYVVVYAHWGEEYSSSTLAQQEAAHAFVESGADAVIGGHPHVVQEVEEYMGKPIFYSLGNFVFDQWFSDAVSQGMGVKVSFGSGTTLPTFETINFLINRDGTVCPVEE